MNFLQFFAMCIYEPILSKKYIVVKKMNFVNIFLMINSFVSSWFLYILVYVLYFLKLSISRPLYNFNRPPDISHYQIFHMFMKHYDLKVYNK